MSKNIQENQQNICKEKPSVNVGERLLLRINDASHAIGLGRTKIYALIQSGKLKVVRIGGRTLIERSEIERLIAVARGEAA